MNVSNDNTLWFPGFLSTFWKFVELVSPKRQFVRSAKLFLGANSAERNSARILNSLLRTSCCRPASNEIVHVTCCRIAINSKESLPTLFCPRYLCVQSLTRILIEAANCSSQFFPFGPVCELRGFHHVTAFLHRCSSPRYRYMPLLQWLTRWEQEARGWGPVWTGRGGHRAVGGKRTQLLDG